MSVEADETTLIQAGEAAVREPTVERLEPLIAAALPVMKESKAGYKTTEFWLTTAFVVLTQLQLLHLPGKYGGTIGTIAAVVAYALSRGLAKAGVSSPS